MPWRKQKLIDVIDKSLKMEEQFVPSIGKQVISSLNFLEKDESIKKEIIRVINILMDESEVHAQILHSILKDLKEE